MLNEHRLFFKQLQIFYTPTSTAALDSPSILWMSCGHQRDADGAVFKFKSKWFYTTKTGDYLKNKIHVVSCLF